LVRDRAARDRGGAIEHLIGAVLNIRHQVTQTLALDSTLAMIIIIIINAPDDTSPRRYRAPTV
jgi:hypothetical protein